MVDQASRRWPSVHLGDIVLRHQETSRTPLDDGLRRFLLVEHMEPDQLRVSQWGDIATEDLPPTFYNVFRSGHVLYPSRNPHLRRACRPDFDGVCGEKTFVLQAQAGLSQDFLAFILQSERFIRHSTKMKIGSTNPHVRWRDVAAYEFPLPPLEEQVRFARALGAIDALTGALDRVRQAVSVAEISMLERVLLSTPPARAPSWGSCSRNRRGTGYRLLPTLAARACGRSASVL